KDTEQILLVALFGPTEPGSSSIPSWHIPLRKNLLSQGEGHNLAPVPTSLVLPSMVPEHDQEVPRNFPPGV
ncbi:hypothetical protein M9458_054156, partial [Cirrhinus mrigala]